MKGFGKHSWKSPRRLFESLEVRAMLSADPLAGITAQTEVTPLASNGTVIGYTPAQVAAAYGFNNITFGSVKGDGTGQTIAIIDAYDDPNIASDLATFDTKFGLPTANFSKIEQVVGGVAPQVDAGWSMEISLDVEWAHAMAPGAKIELIEANQASLSDLLSSIQYAASQTGVSVVSMSWGAGEFSGEASYNSYFTTPSGHTGVSFVASSGDSGSGALWPAISTNVLAVGGTTLNLSGSTYSSETAWSGSGGGKSSFQGEASYQDGVQTSGAAEDPDVSYDANPNTGFAVYDSVPDGGFSGWVEVGGTSAGAPQWAALVAIADQGRVIAKENTLTSAAAAVYTLPSTDFHDVTSGSNGAFSAGKGYDEVTGLGSPQANLVVQGLVGVSTAQQTFTTATLATSSRNGFNSGPRGQRRADEVADASISSQLLVGVTLSEAAGLTTGTTSMFNVGSQLAGNTSMSTASDSASDLALGWLTSGTADQASEALTTTALATTDNDLQSGVSAIQSDALAPFGAATATSLGTGAAGPMTSTAGDDVTTRSLIESLDALFGGDTDWNDRHADEVADVTIVSTGNAAQRTADDESIGPSAAVLAVGLALSALWADNGLTDSKRIPPSLTRRRQIAGQA